MSCSNELQHVNALGQLSSMAAASYFLIRPHKMHFKLEAQSEQRAPAADTKTGMTLSKMQPQRDPRRGNLQARARAHTAY